MATNNCSSVRFLDTCEGFFYFEVTESSVVEDAFGKSGEPKKCWIQGKENKFLLLYPEGNFDIKNLTTEQLYLPECRFNIQIFKNSDSQERKGRAVMIYVNNNDQKLVACCCDENEVCAEAMDVHQKIGGTAHKALFYMTLQTSTKKYMFESTVYQNRFLGFEKDGDVLKLVLRLKVDEVDECGEFTMTECKG